jgi:hypothetical protein
VATISLLLSKALKPSSSPLLSLNAASPFHTLLLDVNEAANFKKVATISLLLSKALKPSSSPLDLTLLNVVDPCQRKPTLLFRKLQKGGYNFVVVQGAQTFVAIDLLVER